MKGRRGYAEKERIFRSEMSWNTLGVLMGGVPRAGQVLRVQYCVLEAILQKREDAMKDLREVNNFHCCC